MAKKKTYISSDMFCLLVKQHLGAVCVREYKFHPVRKWRFDYALPEHKIALEVEGGIWTGGRHINPKGFLGDMDKYNAAMTLGWRVFRCTPDTLLSLNTINMLHLAIENKCE